MPTARPTTKAKIWAGALSAAILLASCGGGEGADRQRNSALLGNTAAADWAISHLHAFHQTVMVVLDDGLIRFSGNARDGVADELNTQIRGSTIAKIRTGQNIAGVLDTEGKLTIRGYDWQRTNPQLPAGATKWVDFDMNLDGVIAVADNGSVVMATRGTTYKIPSLGNGGTKFVRVVAGWFHYGLLDDAGNAYLFGSATEGATTLPAFKNGGTKFVDIDAEFYSTGLVDDAGNAYLFGWVQSGFAIPDFRNGATKFVDIAVGQMHASLIDDKGQIYSVGNGAVDPIETGANSTRSFISHHAAAFYTIGIDVDGNAAIGSAAGRRGVVVRQRVPVVPIAATGDSTLVIDDDGSIRQIGEGLGALPPSTGGYYSIAAGTGHGLVLDSAGRITTWGQNGFGQASTPSGPFFTKTAGGSSFSAGLTATGQITLWGSLAMDGFSASHLSIANDHIVDIAAGADHATALTTRGEVYSFGSIRAAAPNMDNFMEQEGPGPIDFGETFRPYSAIAANGSCSAALSKKFEDLDQVVRPWGTCDPRIKRTLPEGNYYALALGEAHALALGADGSVLAWGDDTFGQSTVPAGLTDAVYIAAGDNHSVAVDASGRVWAWGNNSKGQTTIPDDLRLTVAELSAARAAAAAIPTEPKTAPVELPAEATQKLETLAAEVETPPSAPSGLVTTGTGLTTKKARTITPAQGLRLLRIKGGKKPTFEVVKRAKSSPCKVVKSKLTTVKPGTCAATISYTDAKGKKAKARLVIVITS